MLAVPLVVPLALAVMMAVCAPSVRESLMMLRVKPTEVEPAGMVTDAVAGWASVVSLEVRLIVSADPSAEGIETVPVTLPADSTVDAARETERATAELTEKEFDKLTMEPVEACKRIPELVEGRVTVPVQTPLVKALVVEGVTTTLVPLSNLMFGESVDVKLLA